MPVKGENPSRPMGITISREEGELIVLALTQPSAFTKRITENLVMKDTSTALLAKINTVVKRMGGSV